MTRSGVLLVATLIVAAVTLACAAIPAHATEFAAIVDYATYDPQTRNLTIHFTTPIDPSYLPRPSAILVGGCNADRCVNNPLSDEDSLLVGDDGESVVIALGSDSRETLFNPVPTVQIHSGAFRSMVDGIPNEHTRIPVVMPGERHASLLERAEYILVSNEIVLYLAEPIDPSSVQLGFIHIHAGSVGFTPFDRDGLLRVSDDGMLIIIEPSSDNRDALLTSSEISVTLLLGTYRSASDGMLNGEEGAQIKVRKDRPSLPSGGTPILPRIGMLNPLLDYATYDPKTGNLTIHFVAPIDPLRTRAGEIAVRGCGYLFCDDVSISDQDSLSVSDNGRSVTIALGADAQRVLDRPGRTVYVGPAFYNAINGALNHPETLTLIEGTGAAPARPDNLLEYATYDTADNMLVLGFTAEINPFYISVSRVSIHDDSGSITMSASEFVSLGQDGRSITLEPSESNRYKLSLMDEPVVHLEPGAFQRVADRTETDAEQVRIDVRGDPVFMLDPNVPDDLLVGRAQYNGFEDTSELILYFREAINPYLMDTNRISLVHDDCTVITASDMDVVEVGEDGRSVVFNMSFNVAAALKDWGNVRVHLEEGAFVTKADGVANAAGHLQLIEGFWQSVSWGFSPPTLVAGNRCHLTYAVESPAEILEPYGFEPAATEQYTRMLMLAVRDGLEAWSKLNPQITFEMITEERADITIKWIDFDGNLGYGHVGCLGFGCEISVVAVVPSYIANSQTLGYDEIMRTVAHEFGHNLGLAHHASPDHLMAGSGRNDPTLQDPFDNLGFNIPDLGR